MGFLKEITMDVEIIDKRLVVTPTTHDDVRLIYAIAAELPVARGFLEKLMSLG